MTAVKDLSALSKAGVVFLVDVNVASNFNGMVASRNGLDHKLGTAHNARVLGFEATRVLLLVAAS
jgi:hypothetical protein